MDKILSARVDEGVFNKISLLAQRLHLSKKKIIESAVQLYAQRMETSHPLDIFAQTSGAWKRRQSSAQLIKKAKNEFQKSMRRYHP